MKRYEYKVVALGRDPFFIAKRVGELKRQGWSLVSTYVDQTGNPAVRREFQDGPCVMGIFETWKKEKRGRLL